MSSWQSLDATLVAEGLLPPVAPPRAEAPLPAKKRWIVWSIIAATVCVLIGVAGIGFFASRLYHVAGSQPPLPASGPPAADVTAKPLSWSTNTLTDKDIRKRSRAFRSHQYVQAYQEIGRHDQPCDADIARLLDKWLEFNYGDSDPTNLPPLRALADKIAATAGCDDPLALSVTATLSNEVHEKIKRLERSVAGYEQSRYKAYPKLFATVELGNTLENPRQRLPELDAAALQFLKEGFEEKSLTPEDESELAEILLHGWATAFFKRNADRVCGVIPKAAGFEWLAAVLDGQREVDLAWSARGGGYANTVSSQGWTGFSTHLAKARAAFSKAWTNHPERALAPAEMVYVSMGETGPEEMRLWFDRAINAQIDYAQAWSHMRWGLRPRWHGSHEEMLALGIRALDSGRFDTDVPRKFFDVVRDLESDMELPFGQHIYSRPEIWKHLRRLYEGYIAEPSQAHWRNGWRSTYAAIAFLAEKYDVARQQLEAVDWKPQKWSLSNWGRDLSLMPQKVAALTGSLAAQSARAEAAYERQAVAEAIEAFTKLAQSGDADARTKEFASARLAGLKEEELLAKGEWIELMPSSNQDANWVILLGQLGSSQQGAVEIESGPDGHLLYSRSRVGRNFEVKGEVEEVRSSNDAFQAGIVMGLPDDSNSYWYAFRLKRNSVDGQVVSFDRNWTSQAVIRPASLQKGMNAFDFKYQNDKADAWLNGVQVLHGAAPSKKMVLNSDCYLGLGAYNDMNQTRVRYRNVKMRRLQP